MDLKPPKPPRRDVMVLFKVTEKERAAILDNARRHEGAAKIGYISRWVRRAALAYEPPCAEPAAKTLSLQSIAAWALIPEEP